MSKPLKLAFQNATGSQNLTLTHRVNGQLETVKLPRYIKSVPTFVTTDPAYPIEAGSLTISLPPALEGNEFDTGFHPYQNAEPATIAKAKGVPHQLWKITDDGRTATYIGPTIEAGYGPPIPPIVFVKGFVFTELTITSPADQQLVLEKNRKLQELRKSFKTYKDTITVTFHGNSDLVEIVPDLDTI